MIIVQGHHCSDPFAGENGFVLLPASSNDLASLRIHNDASFDGSVLAFLAYASALVQDRIAANELGQPAKAVEFLQPTSLDVSVEDIESRRVVFDPSIVADRLIVFQAFWLFRAFAILKTS